MNPDYKNLLKIAKSNGISSVQELEDLISEIYPDCNGGEFECAKKILKISGANDGFRTRDPQNHNLVL